MPKKQKRSWVTLVLEFIKLQVAGNILTIGTLLGTFVGDKILNQRALPSLIVASILAHILFFIVDRDWVFNEKGRPRSRAEVWRFIIFMAFNFFLNILLVHLFRYTAFVEAAAEWVHAQWPWISSSVEIYIAQLLSGLVFTLWVFIGLRFWVFRPTWHHARHSKNWAYTVKPVKRAKKRS